VDPQALMELVTDLGLAVDPITPQSVRAVIRQQIAALHPDRSGGEFPSSDVKERYHRLCEALSALDGQLPVPAALDALVQRFETIENRLAVVLASQQMASEATVSKRSREDIRRDARTPYSSRKIGSGVFGAISGAVLTLSAFLKDNPLFGAIPRNPYLLGTLGSVFVLSGVAFGLLWFKEHRAGRRAEWLMSHYGLSVLLRQLIGYRDQGESEEKEVYVTNSELVRAIFESRRWSRSPVLRSIEGLLHPRLPTALAETIAGQHFQELLARGVIRPSGLRGIEPVYAIGAGVVRDLREGHYYFEEW
jgi:hypothetical protein